jgi:hypothetical protein
MNPHCLAAHCLHGCRGMLGDWRRVACGPARAPASSAPASPASSAASGPPPQRRRVPSLRAAGSIPAPPGHDWAEADLCGESEAEAEAAADAFYWGRLLASHFYRLRAATAAGRRARQHAGGGGGEAGSAGGAPSAAGGAPACWGAAGRLRGTGVRGEAGAERWRAARVAQSVLEAWWESSFAGPRVAACQARLL